MNASSLELGVCEFKRYVKILGVYFTYNTSMFHKLNFESIEKSLKQFLKGGRWRGATLIGEARIIKSFALHKVLYRLTLISSNKVSLVRYQNRQQPSPSLRCFTSGHKGLMGTVQL